MDYYEKYLKYKNKYLELKNLIGGDLIDNKDGCKKIDIQSKGNIKIIINRIISKYNSEELKCLTCLNLFMKNISGTINELNLFESFINLEELNLSHNQLEENIDFLNFPSILKKLNLSYNMFTGEIKNITYLTNIKYLDISHNYLNFNFNKLIELQNLTYLDISNNNINCEIENLHSGFEKLEYLNISNNKIKGVIPEYFSNLSKIKYLNFSNTSMYGKFNQEILCLSNLEYIDFSIENFDFNIDKINCTSLIKNNYGSCWNLGIIFIFLLSDKTSRNVINYFNKYNTFENKYNQIIQIDKKYNLDNIFTKSYVNSIELIKYTPDNKIHSDEIKHLIETDNYDKLDKLIRQRKQTLYLNKFTFNKNINTITNFFTQIHNRIKFLNIHLNNDKSNLVEHISVNIEEKTQLLYHEIFPMTGRTEIEGGFIFEEYNFCLLLASVILNKKIKFEIFYNADTYKNYNDYSNLSKIKLHPFNNIKYEYDYLSTYNSSIGILIRIYGHIMCFYECNGIKLFNNCFYDNKTYPFDYDIMFQNINYLNKLGKEFTIYKVSDNNNNQYFIIKIKMNDTKTICTMADIIINNINSINTVNFFDYNYASKVLNFIFIQTY
jgi:hypothetical protein